MATAANDAALHNALIMNLNPDDIEVRDRIGMFWPDKAAALGALMAQDGQNDPIKVRKNGNRAKKPWLLVAGLHRLEGAKMAELRSIDAIEIFGTNEQLREIEASENMHRRDFGPLERAAFVRAIADAAEQRIQAQHGDLSQQQIAARARWEAEKDKVEPLKRVGLEAAHATANLAGAYGWSEEIARSMGLSERAIFRDLALHRAIIAPFPGTWQELAKHPVVGSNASALAEIVAIVDRGARHQVITELLQFPALTVAEAKFRLGMRLKPVPLEGTSKFMKNATANLARLSAADQRSIASDIVENIKPTAMETLRDLLEAKISELRSKGELK